MLENFLLDLKEKRKRFVIFLYKIINYILLNNLVIGGFPPNPIDKLVKHKKMLLGNKIFWGIPHHPYFRGVPREPH